MIKHIKYILILVFVISCNNNSIETPKKPKNLIGKEKMANIIYDMSLFTAAKGVGKYSLENEGISPEAFIYKKYNIDSLQFVLSNSYYSYHMDQFEGIYNRVNERLQKEKVQFDSVIAIEDIERGERSKEQRIKRESLDEIKASDRKLNPKLKSKLERSNRDRLKKVDSTRQ